ncbi:ParB N-terminal domain-containing protein [Novosphingobium flavum]|uniref:plasmid partitioning protein RepB C-terminal domain-containing protein n=1 Tax=Novosphingobium aerophilum TaxID=2839843 RepID=UPI00163A255E|nr:plasmid partitioning protein RepB C-terminal domain-containing protein [Novosphingobium aerophilum]MBC2660182.1 ParB N-terminal domain-containing protein [Novosphingobium aerophilum]
MLESVTTPTPTSDGVTLGIASGFQRELIEVPLDRLVPLKRLRRDSKLSAKYAQILSSIRCVGLVEPPVVVPDERVTDQFLLLDGHLRIEALKELGVDRVECLIARDDDTYTYNKRVTRLPPVQEHRMIVRAVERGVAPSAIADALGLEVQSVRKRLKLLDGVCVEAAELLKSAPCSMRVFEILRLMQPVRQVEAAELMIGQNNFTMMFAKALLAATPPAQLANTKRLSRAKKNDASQQLAQLERELAGLQNQVRSVEDSYGAITLQLTVAKAYVARLLANAAVRSWLNNNRPEYIAEFRNITEFTSHV